MAGNEDYNRGAGTFAKLAGISLLIATTTLCWNGWQNSSLKREMRRYEFETTKPVTESLRLDQEGTNYQRRVHYFRQAD